MPVTFFPPFVGQTPTFVQKYLNTNVFYTLCINYFGDPNSFSRLPQHFVLCGELFLDQMFWRIYQILQPL